MRCVVFLRVLFVLDRCLRVNSGIKENKSIAVVLFSYKSCGNANAYRAMDMGCQEENSNLVTGLKNEKNHRRIDSNCSCCQFFCI